MKKVISVIVVTWNNEQEVTNCLTSFIKFFPSKFTYQIIVVDNNSSDRTVDTIRNKFSDEVLVLEPRKNLGFAGGNNYALHHIKGEYCLLLNPDTICTEDVVTPLVDCLENCLDVGIVAPRLLYEDGGRQASVFRFETPIALLFENMRLGLLLPEFLKRRFSPYLAKRLPTMKVDWVIGAVMMLRSADLKKVNGLSEEYFMYTEDMDLCKKIADVGYATKYISEVKIIHIGGQSETKNTNYKKTEKLLENKLIFIKKFYGLKSARRGRLILLYVYAIKLIYAKLMCAVSPTDNNKALAQRMRLCLRYIWNNRVS